MARKKSFSWRSDWTAQTRMGTAAPGGPAEQGSGYSVPHRPKVILKQVYIENRSAKLNRGLESSAIILPAWTCDELGKRKCFRQAKRTPTACGDESHEACLRSIFSVQSGRRAA